MISRNLKATTRKTMYGLMRSQIRSISKNNTQAASAATAQASRPQPAPAFNTSDADETITPHHKQLFSLRIKKHH